MGKLRNALIIGTLATIFATDAYGQESERREGRVQRETQSAPAYAPSPPPPPPAPIVRSAPRETPAPQTTPAPREVVPRDGPRYTPRSEPRTPTVRPRGPRDPSSPAPTPQHRPRVPRHPPRDDHKPRHNPRYHPPTWDWHRHCDPFYQPFFAFWWWGPWSWDAPGHYRTYANPGSYVRTFDMAPPPGYDEATVTYFKKGFDRTVRVELTRPVMTREGIDLEVTVLRDDRADGDLEQAVRMIAPSREEAMQDYFNGDVDRAQRNRMETLYQHFLYQDIRERLHWERVW